MKWSSLINLAGIDDAGLSGCTDFNDWVILEYISSWQNHSKAIRDGHYVWLDYKHLLSEIPMLSVRTKSGLSARVKKLKEHNLLSSFKSEEGRLFVRVTDFYLEVTDFRPSSVKPVHEDEQAVHENERILNNKVLNNNNLTKLLDESYPQAEKKQTENEKEPDDFVFSEPLQWSQFFIRECGYPIHIVQTAKTIPLFANWIADKVPIGDVRMAMAACHSWNGDRIPDSPMLYKKFLQSVQDEKRRLSEEDKFSQRSGSGRSRSVEDWAKVPRGDDDLWPWAKKHGYSDPGRKRLFFCHPHRIAL